MLEEFSVDRLCDSGAKLLQRCARFIQSGPGKIRGARVGSGHFPNGLRVVGANGARREEMSCCGAWPLHRDRLLAVPECVLSGLWLIGHEAQGIRRYAARLSPGRSPPTGRRAETS